MAGHRVKVAPAVRSFGAGSQGRGGRTFWAPGDPACAAAPSSVAGGVPLAAAFEMAGDGVLVVNSASPEVRRLARAAGLVFGASLAAAWDRLTARPPAVPPVAGKVVVERGGLRLVT